MPNPNELLAKIEQRHLWAYFHKDWLIEIRRQLREQLSEDFQVFVESEAILLTPEIEEEIAKSMPDVAVARIPTVALSNQTEKYANAAAVIEYDEPYEIYGKYSLIIRRSPDNVVVAALEILSPSNKGIGNRTDREKYLKKRDSYLDAGINFLEIDGLTEGQTVVPKSIDRAATFDRHVWTCFHDDGIRRFRAYGWNADQPIPILPWHIEYKVRIEVDLGEAAEAAFRFNQWESLATK